ncbi:hypothetical protein [Herbiconiux sp. UC225_62]|uniref:hypothetical protein n=1 Tax=Herbiconiux sp. UC225_62 TaxID=3350168 RepID=UPI0036D2D940
MSRRFRVFVHRGEVVIGRYGSRKAIPCGPGAEGLALAHTVIGQIQAGVAFVDYEQLATVSLAQPVTPRQPELRLRSGVAA